MLKGLNAVIAAATAFAAIGGYVGIAWHYYDRGWRAHERKIAVHIRQIDKAREDLAADLTRERLANGIARREAIEHALASFDEEAQRMRDAQPAATEAAQSCTAARTAPACALPAGVIARLNRIR